MNQEEIEVVFKKPTRKEKKKEKRITKKKKLYSHTLDEDIRYRGPFGIRALRIAGWGMFVFAMLGVALGILLNVQVVDEKLINVTKFGKEFFSYFGSLAIPCFMLAKFSIILQKKDDYRKMVITYLAIVLGIIGVFYLVYFHYGVRLIMEVLDYSFQESTGVVNDFIAKISANKLCFNVFVDMLIWACYFMIIEYKIKKPTRWKKILQYALSWLPFMYSLACFIIKLVVVFGNSTIVALVLPWMTTTSPLLTLAFMRIVYHMRKQKREYMELMGEDANYEEFQKTNAYSLAHSKSIMKVFLWATLWDFILLIIVIIVYKYDMTIIETVRNVTGIGYCAMFLLFAPLILLFSCTREFKNDKLDLLVPVIGIILVAILFLECSFYSLVEWIGTIKALMGILI